MSIDAAKNTINLSSLDIHNYQGKDDTALQAYDINIY